MAIPIYLWLTDDVGNTIKGSVGVQQREGEHRGNRAGS